MPLPMLPLIVPPWSSSGRARQNANPVVEKAGIGSYEVSPAANIYSLTPHCLGRRHCC